MMTTQKTKFRKPTFEKEIRFAVVMYGGVSLAIYINGVAQELYKMVRATARKRNEDGSFGDYIIEKPDGTEAVYRKLGERLHARFIVDILSGTSAGGINAIFLAKALANNQPMNQLEDMWINQGDIELLINDERSVADIKNFPFQPPTSLLNSQRMYYRLLDAFDQMDQAAPRTAVYASPFVDELDLYVTATDIRGLSLSIPLADETVHEYRYRTVFRFNYSTPEPEDEASESSQKETPDFARDKNPFLAFAARSTSSFPFAFQPVKLMDARDVLKIGAFIENYDYDTLTLGWNRFYRDYNPKTDNFSLHSFGDGGYLDNKPFSYITETLLRRRADTPVDRKLFYIEPAPERVMKAPLSEDDRPDAVENVLAALTSLPRYETIREDLLQIKTRNDLIERTNNILRQIEQSRAGKGIRKLSIWKAGGSSWSRKYLDKLIDQFGSGYAAYHQLRVAEVLDNLAALVARNLGMEEEGKSFEALRRIFEEWRTRNYSPNSENKRRYSENKRRSENDLLFRLDTRWRIRRLYFLSRTIDDILLGLETFRTPRRDSNISMEEEKQRKYAREIVNNSGGRWRFSERTERQYFEALSWIKRYLNQAFAQLRRRGRQLRTRNLSSRKINKQDDLSAELNSYVQAIQMLKIDSDNVEGILKRENRIDKVCQQIESVSLALASRPDKNRKRPQGYLYRTMSAVSARCKEALALEDRSGKIPQPTEPLPDIPEKVLKNVRDCLSFYYNHFEYFDMLTFPITYATPIGESDVVDVYRISPQDAKDLISIEKDNYSKLRGTILGNFGAFFRKEWRENDILWGRLDGAERIITTLLPDSPERNELLLRARLIILNEKLSPANKQKLARQFGDTWKHFDESGELPRDKLGELHEKLRKFLKDDYVVDPKFSRETTLNVLTRSVPVMERLFTGLAEKRPNFRTPIALLTRLGRISLPLIKYTVPGTPGRRSLQRWLNAAYAVEVLLIVASLLLGVINDGSSGFNKVVFWFGIIFLFVTAGANVVVQLVGIRINRVIESLFGD